MPALATSSTPESIALDTYRDDETIHTMDENAQSPIPGAGVGNNAATMNASEENVPAAMRGIGLARHTLGLLLLLVVVFLWTTSNFLGSVCVPPAHQERFPDM
jgi:hypothetical protein